MPSTPGTGVTDWRTSRPGPRSSTARNVRPVAGSMSAVTVVSVSEPVRTSSRWATSTLGQSRGAISGACWWRWSRYCWSRVAQPRRRPKVFSFSCSVSSQAVVSVMWSAGWRARWSVSRLARYSSAIRARVSAGIALALSGVRRW